MKQGIIRSLVLLFLLGGIQTVGQAATYYYITPSTTTPPDVKLYSYGGIDGDYYRERDFYLLYGAYTTNQRYVENKPYVMLRVNIPADGRYLVNFSASRGTAKLRHQYSGPIIREWDFRNASCNPCDYLVQLDLSQGYHYFYFWTQDSYKYVYSASVVSDQ
jgi:hypothetical protein